MRILHTSDWHLGCTLHDAGRQVEHAAFLAWLSKTVAARGVDVLLVTGDVFDTINPPAEATRLLYEFLVTLQKDAPGVQVVLTGGNHDSAGRLEAPRDLFRLVHVQVLGAWPWERNDGWDVGRVCMRLASRDGRDAAWFGAVPYLRPGDLGRWNETAAAEATPVDALRRCYAETMAQIEARRGAAQEAIVLSGHLYARDAHVCEGGSERLVQKGNLDAAPADIFPPAAAYVALGHLHLAQSVGGEERIRYSGSPLPLSFVEVAYPHQVVLVELTGAGLAGIETLEIPRVRTLLRVHGERETVLEQLRGLAVATESEGLEPLVEVEVTLTAPDPGLRAAVEKELEGKRVRLACVRSVFPDAPPAEAFGVGGGSVNEADPVDVFRLLWRHACGGNEPDDAVEKAFRTLLEEVQNPVA
jgi:exonuclease SbcD